MAARDMSPHSLRSDVDGRQQLGRSTPSCIRCPTCRHHHRRHWQYFVANLGLCCPIVRWALTPEGRHRKWLSLTNTFSWLAFRSPARRSIRRTPVRHQYRASSPRRARTVRGRRVDQSELRLPRRTGKCSRLSGRTIRLMVARYPARSPGSGRSHCYLAGGPGDIAPWSQRAHRCRFHLTGTSWGEPARHHVLGAGATCAAIDNFNRGFDSAYSEVTEAPICATKVCHQELAATGADLSAYTRPVLRLRRPPQVLGLPRGMSGAMAPTWPRRSCATTPKASAVSSSFGLTDDLHHSRKLAVRTRRLRQPLSGLRDGNGHSHHPHLEKLPGLVNNSGRAADDNVSDRPPADLKVTRRGALVDWLRTRTMTCPCSAPRQIGSTGSPPAAPMPSRRSPRTGQAGHRHPVRMSLPSATGCPLALPVAKTTPSRRRRISPRPAG